jgi:hypothetical protein
MSSIDARGRDNLFGAIYKKRGWIRKLDVVVACEQSRKMFGVHKWWWLLKKRKCVLLKSKRL